MLAGIWRSKKPFGYQQERGAVILLSVVFIALGIWYSLRIPPFEVLGETTSYERGLAWAQGKGSSVLWKAPPLHSLLGAGILKTVHLNLDVPPFERNPFWAGPETSANRNAVLHLNDGPPFQGHLLALHLWRLVSVGCALVAWLLNYLSLRRIFPHRSWLALGSMLLLALNPQYLFLGSGAIPEALLWMLCALALYEAFRVLEGRGLSLGWSLALGVTVGLASLAGFLGVLLLPFVFALYLVCWVVLRVSLKRLWRPALISLGMALLIGGWWYVGWIIAGERSAGKEWALHSVRGWLLSFWGLFGWGNVLPGEGYEIVVWGLFLLSLGGWGLVELHWYWRKKQPQVHGQVEAVLLFLWMELVLLWLLWRLAYGRGVLGWMLFPAGALLGFAFYRGIVAWLPQRWWRFSFGGLAVLLFLMALYVPLGCFPKAYALPPRVSLTEVPEDIHRVEVTFGGRIFLLGYQEEDPSVERKKLVFYWVGLRRMSQDYSLHLRVLDVEGHLLKEFATYPGEGMYPTRLWVPGEVIVDRYVLSWLSELPRGAKIELAVRRGPDGGFLPAFNAQGKRVGDWVPLE